MGEHRFTTGCQVMNEVHLAEVAAINLLNQLKILFHYTLSSNSMSHQCRQNWEQLHLLSLIVDNLCFFFLPTDISELTADDRITEADG